MINVAVLGAGRIGRVHAENISRHPAAELVAVVDPILSNAQTLAAAFGGRALSDPLEVINNKAIDAVIIGTPTDTHVDLMLRAAAAGKAILCEKPVDLDITRAKAAEQELKKLNIPVMLGFNRRFDPSAAEIKRRLGEGDIGELHQVIITSRDPGLAPAEYLKHSGGIFRDMVIHDFDMARWLLGEDPVEVYASGSRMFAPELEALGDYDTVMVQMHTASGKQCHINCSRQAVYGYDQRIEVFGSQGMLMNDNLRANTVREYTAHQTESRVPLLDFFMQRYTDAYRLEMDAFITAVSSGKPLPVTPHDGCMALKLADAAQLSVETRAPVKIS